MPRRRLKALVGGLPGPFWTLWVGTLINRLGSFVLPFLTLFLTVQRGVSPASASAMVGLYGLGAFGASLAGGAIADRLGRRAALLLSLFGGAVMMLVVPWVTGMVALGAAVTTLGFFAELYRPGVSAAITDLVPSADRPRAFALLYWVINVGAAVAPVLAGFLATRSYVTLFVADAATMAIYGLVVLWWVPETRPVVTAPLATGGARVAPSGLLVAFRDPLLVGISLGTLLVASLFFQAISTLPLEILADGLGESGFGLAIGANGLLVVLASLPIAHLVAGRRPLPVLALAAAITGLGLGLTGPASTVATYALTVAVWTLGEIMLAPVAPSLVAELAPIHLRGAYQGVFHAGWGLAAFLGPLVGGAVLQRFGAGVLWPSCLATGLAAAALFLALVPLHRRRTAAPVVV